MPGFASHSYAKQRMPGFASHSYAKQRMPGFASHSYVNKIIKTDLVSSSTL
jgi:hypothetical protein